MRHEITLGRMPDAPVPGGVCVGIIDGQPLSFVGRQPYRGTEPLDQREVSDSMVSAVDAAAKAIFGDLWVQDLATVTGLNPRTCQRDRIGKYGLPLPAMLLLGTAASHESPRALGYIMLALAELRLQYRPYRRENNLGFDFGDLDPTIHTITDYAIRLLTKIALMRAEHQAPKLKDEGSA
jgi:hypothetical protein